MLTSPLLYRLLLCLRPSTILSLVRNPQTSSKLTNAYVCLCGCTSTFSDPYPRSLLADLGADAQVPVPNVSKAIMELVKEYTEYKVENPNPPQSEDKKDERRTDDILPWDKDFMGKLEQSTLFDLIMVRSPSFALLV